MTELIVGSIIMLVGILFGYGMGQSKAIKDAEDD